MGAGPGSRAPSDTALEEQLRRGPAQGTFSLVWAFPTSGNSEPAKKQWLVEPSVSAGGFQVQGTCSVGRQAGVTCWLLGKLHQGLAG